MKKENKIIIYQDKKYGVKLETQLENESIWLTQEQISILFQTDRSSITKHIKNIFSTSELDEKSNVQKMHIANSDKPVKFFSLDVILSVGYRVNSKKATEFRVWATNILKKHIVEGFTINESRLTEARDKLKELQNVVAFIQESAKKKALTGQEAEILSLLSNYSKTLTLLNEYDSGGLKEIKGKKTDYKLTYEECKKVVAQLQKGLREKGEASDIFGNEKDNSFESTIKNIYQTFGGKELYKTIQDKASNLIYLIIKNHPFSDGNKRIGSFLFVYFLDKADSLYKTTGEKKINDNALTALALLIAESDPKEKDVLVKIIKNLIV